VIRCFLICTTETAHGRDLTTSYDEIVISGEFILKKSPYQKRLGRRNDNVPNNSGPADDLRMIGSMKQINIFEC